MKKFIAFLVIACLFSGALLAAPAKAPATKPATKFAITTMTKEFSTAMYPGVLVPGSLSGTSVFVADYAYMPNAALFEYLYGATIGFLSMSSDFGKIGLSLSPVIQPDLRDIDVSLPDDCIGLYWAGKTGDMPLGVSLQYGVENGSFSTDQFGTYNPDFENWTEQFVALRLGSVLGGVDLGLGVSLGTGYYEYEDWSSATSYNYKEIYDDSKLVVDLAARTKVPGGITAYAMLSWINGIERYTYLYDSSSDYVEEEYNTKLSFKAGAGKDIHIGDSLKISVALGVEADGDADAKTKEWYVYYPQDIEYDYYDYDNESVFSIPLNVKVEGKINDNWSFSTGVRAVILEIEGEKEDVNTASQYEKIQRLRQWEYARVNPTLDYAFGLTGVIGDLKLDMFINPAIFITAPYFIGGSGAGALNTGVALSYIW